MVEDVVALFVQPAVPVVAARQLAVDVVVESVYGAGCAHAADVKQLAVGAREKPCVAVVPADNLAGLAVVKVVDKENHVPLARRIVAGLGVAGDDKLLRAVLVDVEQCVAHALQGFGMALPLYCRAYAKEVIIFRSEI